MITAVLEHLYRNPGGYNKKDLITENTARYMLSSSLCYNKKTLDVGCKHGKGATWLGRYAKDLVMTDIKNQLEFNGVPYRFVEADFTKQDVFNDGEFECVVMLEVLEHVSNPEALIANAHRVLGNNGVFIFSTPCVDREVETHIKPFFTAAEIKRLIKDKFKIQFMTAHLGVSWFVVAEKV